MVDRQSVQESQVTTIVNSENLTMLLLIYQFEQRILIRNSGSPDTHLRSVLVLETCVPRYWIPGDFIFDDRTPSDRSAAHRKEGFFCS
jgi:hypothetical protein